MSRVSRWFVFAMLLLLVGSLAGCIDEKVSEGSVKYTFSWWVPVVTFVGGLVLLPAGWALRKTRFGWMMLVAGPLLLVVFGPGTVTDHVTVNDDQFTLHTGFWFSPTHFDVRFDDIQRIELTSETRRGRRGRKTTSYFIDCHNKSGGMDHVPIGTLMEEAVVAVLDKAHARSIPIADLRGSE